jgi:FixJ family two-component response regulator
MTAATIHVIDDDASVRRALSRLLRSHDHQVETYLSARDFLNRKLNHGPACIVLDLQMPEMDGLELQQLLAEGRENPPIVFITGHGDIPNSVRAMKAGAVDFLTKPFDEAQLLTAVNSAIARSHQACASRDEFERSRSVFESLTPRERQVCLRVTQGMLNKQIAAEFGTTEKTVKVQRRGVMQKLGAQSVADLVRFVEHLLAAGYVSADAKPHGQTGRARRQIEAR